MKKVTCLLGSALVLLSTSIQARTEAVAISIQNTAMTVVIAIALDDVNGTKRP
jgi:hypothetical protein